MLNFDDILLELSYKVPEGIVDLTKTHHLVELKRILKENGVDDPSPYLVVAEHYFSVLQEVEKKDTGYVSIGFGRFKKKGEEDKKDAQLFKKEKSGKFVAIKGDEEDKEEKTKDKKSVGGTSVFTGGASVFAQEKKPQGDENPEGTYDPKNKLQKAVVEAKDTKGLMKALDKMGEAEKSRMLDKVEAGAGGPVASTGETLCVEAQSDMIQGRYDSEKVRKSKEYQKNLDNVRNIQNNGSVTEKKKLEKELVGICQKMGYFKEDGTPDYFTAMQMKAEADTYIQQNLKEFKTTKVSKTKFKSDEDRISWLRSAFYSSHSLMNNGPADWDREKGNGRVMKANATTDGAARQLLTDGLKNAKTPEEKAHYQNQLKVWDKFKGYHDTYLVYTNKDGFASMYHISNKKSDELDDPQNNTTPETRLRNFEAAAKEAGFDEEQAKVVNKAQNRAMDQVSDNDAVAKNAYSDIKDTRIVAVLSGRLPARSETDLKDEYYEKLKYDKSVVNTYKNKYGDKWESKLKNAKPEEVIDIAIDIVKKSDGDLSKLSGNFTKFILKQGQLAQGIFEKNDAGLTPKQIVEKYKGKYSEAEVKAILASKTMKMLADVKTAHAAGLEAVHKGFIQSLHKADGTKPNHTGENGPAVSTYVAGTLRSLHIDTYVTNYDDNVQIEMGGVGCKPRDVRGCMAKLSGFKGNTDSPESRKKLNDHLTKHVKVDADSNAVYLVGEDGKTRTYIATDTWRQAGSSKKIATAFGDDLRKCLKNSVGQRLLKNK